MNYELRSFTWNIATHDHRRDVYSLERSMLTALGDSNMASSLPVQNLFAQGMYARSLTIPKNGVLTGALHKQDHFSILLKGEMTITTEQGPKRISAGDVFITRAGSKKAGFAHIESTFLTIERTDHTDVDAAQAQLVTNDFEGWLKEQECPLQLPQAF
jgi:quercetin dioxygenase-like cupin family protein